MFRLSQVENARSQRPQKGNLTCARSPSGVSSWCERQRRSPMDYTILQWFRHELYHCFTRAADALFDVCDALLTDPAARTFVELSQAASFQRAWPSLYEALEDGRIDRSALLRVFATALPQQLIGTRVLLGL